MRLDLGEWLPDLPPSGNPGALEAKNVIAEKASYRALKGLASYTGALSAKCLGAGYVKSEAGTVFNFAGDASALYSLSGTTWNDVSKLGGYSASSWEFARFGTRMLAVDKGDVPQYFDPGVSSLFADLPGSPPQAARIGVVRDFVVLGDLSSNSRSVQWSGFNNSEIWDNLPAQADSQELFNGGAVQQIVGGEYGVIFKEHSIYRMDYAGPPVIFSFAEVESNRGTPSPGSVMRQGNTIFYLGHDGFYAFNGQSSEPIGTNRVNRWFEGQIDPAAYSEVRSAIDRRNRLAVWAFRAGSGAAQNDRLLIYNWGANRWSYGEVDTEILADLLSSGFTLDGLDAPLPGGIDADSIPVESAQYVGGNLSFVAFDSSHRAATFNGAALDAVVDTKEVSDPGGAQLRINAVRPLVSANGATVGVQIGKRNQLQAGYQSYGAAYTLDASGKANTRETGRYLRARLNISGDFDHAIGVDLTARKAGRR